MKTLSTGDALTTWPTPTAQTLAELAAFVDTIAKIRDTRTKLDAPLEEACRLVIAKGYDPASECRIECVGHEEEPKGQTRTLIVLDVPVFELTVTRTSAPGDRKITWQVVPHVIGWPKSRHL